MQTCYIVFEADPSKHYAYRCGKLLPQVGQSVVVLVRDGAAKKIVTCVALSPDLDPKAHKEIFGLVIEQPKETL